MKKLRLFIIAIFLLGLGYYSVSKTIQAKENLKEKVMEYSQTEEALVPLSIFDIFSVNLK